MIPYPNTTSKLPLIVAVSILVFLAFLHFKSTPPSHTNNDTDNTDEQQTTTQIPVGNYELLQLYADVDGNTRFTICADVKQPDTCWNGILMDELLTVAIKHDGMGKGLTIGKLVGWSGARTFTKIVKLSGDASSTTEESRILDVTPVIGEIQEFKTPKIDDVYGCKLKILKDNTFYIMPVPTCTEEMRQELLASLQGLGLPIHHH